MTIQSRTKSGRVSYAVDSKDRPTDDYGRITGWVGTPDDHRNRAGVKAWRAWKRRQKRRRRK